MAPAIYAWSDLSMASQLFRDLGRFDMEIMLAIYLIKYVKKDH